MKMKVWGSVLGALLLMAGAAIGQVTADVYKPVAKMTGTVQSAATAYRTAVDGSDSRDWTTALSTRQETGGDAELWVSPRFSDAGVTCWLEVGLFDVSGTLLDVAVIGTLTSGGALDANGDYLSASGAGLVPTGGARYYEVRCHDVSGSNTVDLVAWTAGGRSRVAGSSP